MMPRVISNSAAPASVNSTRLDLRIRSSDAIVLFEILDLDGQRRLADVQNPCSRGKAAMLGDCMESSDLAEYY